MTIENIGDLYDEPELARYLKCSVRHLQDERRRGVLPYFKIGGKARFTESHIEEYLRRTECNGSSNLETIGSAPETGALASIVSLTPPPLDKQSRENSALRRLEKRSKSSPTGISKPTGPQERRQGT